MCTERVCHIVNEDLGMRNLPVRCVPSLLTLDQKRVDETWMHQIYARNKNTTTTMDCEGGLQRSKDCFLSGKILVTVSLD